MNTLELAKVAQAYYDGLKAPSLAQGWDKYVATNGTVSMFVKHTMNAISLGKMWWAKP